MAEFNPTTEQKCSTLLGNVMETIDALNELVNSDRFRFAAGTKHQAQAEMRHAMARISKYGYQSCDDATRDLIRQGSDIIQRFQAVFAGTENDPQMISTLFRDAADFTRTTAGKAERDEDVIDWMNEHQWDSAYTAGNSAV